MTTLSRGDSDIDTDASSRDIVLSVTADRSFDDRPHILVCGWAGAGNVGDELLTRWIVAAIEDAGGRAVVSSRDLADTRGRHPSAEATRWGPRDLGSLRGVDGLVVGPGGVIQDSSSVWSLPGHLVKALVAHRRGIPIAAVGVGAEPLRRRSSQWLLRRSLGDAVAVVCRDELSAKIMRAAGVDAEVAVDVVFDLVVPTVDHRSDLVVALGPGVKPGRLRSARSRLTSEDPRPVGAAIVELASRLDARIILTSFRGERDRHYSRELMDVLGPRAEIAPHDPDELRRAVAGARAVVTSRYHAAVLALAGGVPTVVRSNETKLVELVDQTADDRRIVTASDWDAVARWCPGHLDEGFVPGSVDRAREAVATVVLAAARRPI